MVSQREKNRKLVQDFYTMAFLENRHAEACERYVGEPYIQHNPFVPDGVEGFLKFFEDWEPNKRPDFEQKIHRIVADEELVALHATIKHGAGAQGSQLVDIFRIEDDRIVEHWDVYMAIPDPAGIPHDNGTYQGTPMGLEPFTRPDSDEIAEKNLAIAKEFYQMCFVEKRYAEAADTYFGPRYIQHNSFVEDGIEGFKKEFVNSERRKSPTYVQRPLRFMADENGVVVHETIHYDPEHRGVALIDIFRMEDFKIVEHWDVFMEIPDPATVPHDNGVL